MSLREAFRCFARNGRWGTCAACPRVQGLEVAPELCEHTERYDHQLTVDVLADTFNREGFTS